MAARRELASQLGFHVIDTELAGQKRAEFDACFEATGNPSAISDAVDATRPGGSVVLLGVSTRDLGLSAWRLVEGELSLIASKSHTMKDFAEAVEALVSGAIDVSAFPLELFPLEDALLAFAGVMAQPDAYVKRMMVALPLMGTNG
ncbi:hypothetical protein GCM10007382_11220 [Salinibacterium xinjiangense]|nr:hypothetical protein GCM10007382_11220 [Salinibacterium xinjiangense]